MVKKTFIYLMMILIVMSSFAGCGKKITADGASEKKAKTKSEEKEPIEIGFIIGNQTMDFFLKMQKGVQESVAKDDNIMTYSFDDDATKQSGIFDDLIVRNVDIIITSILDAESVYASLVKCHDAGIPVILLDGYPDSDEYKNLYVCAVIDDLYDAGYQHGKLLCEAIGGKGEIGYLWIAGLSEPSNQRVYGFENAVGEYPDVRLVAFNKINGVDTETCMNTISAQLQVHPEIDAYFAPWANAGLAAVSALATADMQNVVLSICDVDSTLARYIQDGSVKACTDLNSYGMGVKAVNLAYQYLAGVDIKEEVYKVTTIQVTEDNVEDYIR